MATARGARANILEGLPKITKHKYNRDRRACRSHVRAPDREVFFRTLYSNGDHCLLKLLAPKWGHCTPNPVYPAGAANILVANTVRREDMQMFAGVPFSPAPWFAVTCEVPPPVPGGVQVPTGAYGHLEVPVVRWHANTGLGKDWEDSLYGVATGDNIFMYEGQMEIIGDAPPAAGVHDTREPIFVGYMTCPVTDQCMDETRIVPGPRPPGDRGTNSAGRNAYGIISNKMVALHKRAIKKAGTDPIGRNMERLSAECVQEIVDRLGGPVHLMLGPTVIVGKQRSHAVPANIAAAGFAWAVFPHSRTPNTPWERRVADHRTPPVVFDEAKWATMRRLRTLALEVWDFRSGNAYELSFKPGARTGNAPTPGSDLANEHVDTFRWIKNWFDQMERGFQQQNPPHPGLDLLIVAGLNTNCAFADPYNAPVGAPLVDWKPRLQRLVNPNGGRVVLIDFDQELSFGSWRYVEPHLP
ncbi:hypothetical protein MAPG_01476 [Magnaporthiopsis poae ATCC 64411]|uniref:Uncharacterized protein n=1 Tax=Magnaporthiopsis poae (strain ATCC 64411 / 73-15) TaxID=644358 RepID=A0A0C4DNT1_MAGP6|nr:hypothetical protein MAPG_01476 [Magnaporthiopsis poae ATCC 64411]